MGRRVKARGWKGGGVMSGRHRFPYRWTLRDARFTRDKGKVFSCFSCGGGSTMGYKLAGFDVVGCCEIDPRMAAVYEANHHPRHVYVEDIRDFAKRESYPDELYGLDVLDGSPPCSTFSMMGERERNWGKEKRFREGQKAKVLDTLFFDFIALAARLKPKAVIAENVKGLLLGEASGYVRRIHEEFDKAGYYCRHFLLDASRMGVPQERERVFFICVRKDIASPVLTADGLFDRTIDIDMEFDEPPICLGEFSDFAGTPMNASTRAFEVYSQRELGDKDFGELYWRAERRDVSFGTKLLYLDRPLPTLTAKSGEFTHFHRPVRISRAEITLGSSFPLDFDFGSSSPVYICGMSVPPVMMAQVAARVYERLLAKIAGDRHVSGGERQA